MTDPQYPTDEELLLCSPDAERAVIGAVIISQGEAFHECRLELPDGAVEFHTVRWQWVWQAFEKMIANKTPIDLLTLSQQLESDGKLEDIGGSAELTGLVNAVPFSLNARAYAVIVHDFYFRRSMVKAANQVAAAAYDKTINRDQVTSNATTAINQVVRSTSNGRMVTISDSIAAVDRIIEANSKLDKFPGIPTPLIDLNKMMGGGAQKTDVNLLIGRPGQGKTSLLMQIAMHAAKYKVGESVFDDGKGYGMREDVFEYNHVAIFTMEMPHEQLTMRLLAQLANIDFQMLRAGKLRDNQWEAYYKAISDLSELDIYIEFIPGCTPSYMRSRCEILSSQGMLDLVCVDSLNLMQSDVNFGRRTDLATDYCAIQLKNIAAEFNVPIWAAHQMNRGIEHRGENAKPKLSDMNEGGEKPVDGTFFIHHELVDPDEKIAQDTRIKSSSIICEKQRNGPVGEIPVFFKQDRFKFCDVATIKLN
jgi:replicative DNA helicase